MTIANPSFEVAGASPGLAQNWTYTSSASAAAYADYDTGLEPVEDFEEGWDSNESYLFAFDVVNLAPAEYQTNATNPKYVENFEEFWDANQSYAFGVVGTYAMYSTNNWEGFDQQWDSNESYLYALGATTSAGIETFESQWDANETYAYALGLTTAAIYDTVPEAVEDFEEDWLQQVMTTL